MKLPGTPAAVAILHPLQFFLAGALLARHPGAELWYGRPRRTRCWRSSTRRRRSGRR